MLELITCLVPELFLSKEQIHASRLLDYLLFLFRSVFNMQMDTLFNEFCGKLMSKSRSLPQVLAPFIGILTNLYIAIHELQGTGAELSEQLTGQVSPSIIKLRETLSKHTVAISVDEEAKGDSLRPDSLFHTDQFRTSL